MKFKNIKKKSPQTGEKKIKSPSNSRTISSSEDRPKHFKFPFPKISHIALIKFYHDALRAFVVTIFIVAVIIVGTDFKNNLQTKKNIDSQREVLVHDLKFWEDFISKHQNFPDAYFQASILEYRLGNISKAKTYAEKGSALDPNSQFGKKIEEFFVNK